MTKETVDKYLDDLRAHVINISNELAYIDRIDEILVPNPACDEDEVESPMTDEQQKKYDSIMDSLKHTVQTEFSG